MKNQKEDSPMGQLINTEKDLQKEFTQMNVNAKEEIPMRGNDS